MGLSLRNIGRNIRDIFDANTQADQQRRLAAGQARMYADQQRARGNMTPARNIFQAPLRGTIPGFGVSLSEVGRQIPRVLTTPSVWEQAPRVNVGSFRGSGLIEDFINSPFKQGLGISQLTQGQYKKGLGNLAVGAIEGPIGLIPAGKAAQAGRGAKLLPRVLAGAKVGLKEGAFYGGSYGAGQAAAQNASGGDIIKSGVSGAAIGGLAGGVLGGGLPLAGVGARKIHADLSGNEAGFFGKHPKISAADDKIKSLTDNRKMILRRGGNKVALRQNDKAINAAIRNRNRVAKDVSQGGYVGPGQSKILKDYGVDSIRNAEDFKGAVAKVAKQENISLDVAQARVQRMLEAARQASVQRVSPDAPLLKVSAKVKKNPEVKKVLAKLSSTRVAANTEADLTANVIKSAADRSGVKLDADFINRYQTGKLKDGAEKQVGEVIKRETDRIFRQQQQISSDIQYRKDYVPQTYSNPAEQVEEAVTQLSKRTGAEQRRVFSTYKEAGQFGLTPKYKTLDKMIGANASEARRALGNRDVIETGLKSGLFTPNRRSGLSAIDGFTDFNGNQIYASKQVADVINGVTQESTIGIDKLLKKSHELNSLWQDIGLAGGIPGTPINFFTFGQVVKDLSAGRISVAKDFLYSFNSKATARRFAQNADFVRKMADRGVPLSAKSGLTNEGKSGLASFWGSAVNQPTFGRFMPNQYLSVAENSFKKLEKKIGTEAALDLSADITKKFYGITDQIAKGRDQRTQDAIGALFFAPRYRESVLNTLFNTGKSVTTKIGDPAYSMNRRLFAGMAVTAVAYDQLNRQINGHGMLGNRENQELSLQIPYGEKDKKGNQKVVNIPFMPGFMTIPRAAFNAATSLLRGDVAGVIGEGTKTLSMPLKTGGELISNKDYFGDPIRVDEKVAGEQGVDPDSALTAAGKVALHLGKQATPAWVRAGIDHAQGKPIEKVVAQGLEAPVRFGQVTNPETTAYFDTKDEAYKRLNPNQKAKFDSIFPKNKNVLGDEIKETNPNDRITKASVLKGDPSLFEEVAKWQKDLRGKTKGKIDPVYDLSWDKAQNVLWARSLAPGESGETKQELLYGQPWYKAFKDQETAYYQSLEKKLGKKDDPYGYPDETPKITTLSDAYYKLPKGTGERSDFLDANPALLSYWGKRDQATNRHRIALGLPPIDKEEFASGGGRSGSGRGGRGRGARTAGSAYKYAVALSTGGSAPSPKVSVRSTGAPKGKAYKSSRPKVSLKRSKV